MKLFGMKRQGPGHEKDPRCKVAAGLHYRDVLVELFDRLAPNWYLEIGSRDGRSLSYCTCNFVAVDPVFKVRYEVFNDAPQMLFFQQTSDDFFASGFLDRNAIRPELAFIDGMHLFEFALRDFMNSEKAMNAGGTILFHDVAPFNVPQTTRDETYMSVLKRPWTGDVWKVMDILLEYRPDLNISVLDAASTGLGVVSGLDPASRVLDEAYDEIVAQYEDMEFDPEVYYAKVPFASAQNWLERLPRKTNS